MDVLAHATALRSAAARMLETTGIERTIRPHGRLAWVGSYALDLMAWRDVDGSLLRDEPFSLDAHFALGRELAERPGVIGLSFGNFLRRKTDVLPTGLYWKVKVQEPDGETRWKIDLWSLDAEEFDRGRAWVEGMRSALTPETRRRILEVKSSLLTPEGRTPILSGKHICEAVVRRGLRDDAEIRAYLRQNGVEGV